MSSRKREGDAIISKVMNGPIPPSTSPMKGQYRIALSAGTPFAGSVGVTWKSSLAVIDDLLPRLPPSTSPVSNSSIPLIASVALPAWYLGHNPSERVVAVSYSAELAKTHANDFRRVVTDPTYQAVFPKMILARETDSEIHTTLRGRRYATSIQGTLTGRVGNLFIIDYPLKPGDPASVARRERVLEWYRSTLVTRPDDKQAARVMVVMQRIHVDDLVGFLLDSDAGFEVLSLPAVAQSTTTYDLGGGRTHVREKGDLLHPTHEPGEVLRDIKKSMGSMLFSAKYQQAPEPAGGKIIKRKMLRYYSAVVARSTDRIVLSWAIALSEQETGHYSACIVLLNRGELYYVLEVIRGKFPFDKLKDKILEVKRRYEKAALLIEDASISTGLIQSLREKQVNVVAIPVNRDKQSRVISQIDLFEGGSVLLPKG